jgi:hypothetical protein
MESTWVFTYWEAGDKATRASSTPTEKVFGSLGKLGEEWRPTNELPLYILYQCFEQLILDLDLDQLRRRVGKKRRRGHNERDLAHQGYQAAFFLLGRMRATSAGSCDAGASGGEFGGGTEIRRVG